jgi:hypothetical protein
MYDFATAPFWISLYMKNIFFSFFSVRRQQESAWASTTIAIFYVWDGGRTFCKDSPGGVRWGGGGMYWEGKNNSRYMTFVFCLLTL